MRLASNVGTFLLLAAASLLGQVPQPAQPLSVSNVFSITSTSVINCSPSIGVIDNRSTVSRSNDFHSFYVSGTGAWTVAMNYSDSSCTGPWTSFGSQSSLNNGNSLPWIGWGQGYHPFIQIAITGNASVNYAATKNMYYPATAGTSSGFAWAGTWVNSLSYNLNNVVYYNSSTWIAVAPSLNVTPGTNTSIWQLFGSTGITNVTTTLPLTGGPITGTGDLACPTCDTSASALTAGQLLFGDGLQGIVTGDLIGAVTTSGGSTTTIATVNSSPGPCGGSNVVCAVTTNSAGQVTSQTTYPVTSALPASGTPGQYPQIQPNVGNTTTYQLSSGPTLYAAFYNWGPFTPLSPGTITGGSGAVTISLAICPLGIYGDSTWAPIYFTAGTGGTAEALTPSGGTCSSATLGINAGTVIVTPLQNHGAGYTAQSATAGVEEAVLSLPTAGNGGGTVQVGPGTSNVYATITIPSSYIKIIGVGRVGTTINASTLTTGPLFSFPNGGDQNEISAMNLTGPNNGTTTQFVVNAIGATYLTMQQISANGFGQGISLTDGSGCAGSSIGCTQGDVFRDVRIFGLIGDGAYINTLVNAGTWDNVMFATYSGKPSIGWEVKAAVGVNIGNSYCFEVQQCVLLDPPSGSTVGVVTMINLYADGPGYGTGAAGMGLHISPSSGGVVNTIKAIGGGFGGYNFGVLYDNSGTIEDITISHEFIAANKDYGILANYGTNLTYEDNWVEANGNSTLPGLAITGTSGGPYPTNVHVHGGVYGAGSYGGGSNTQTYGIYVQYAVNVKIENIESATNITGAVIDAGGNTNVTISNVPGYTGSGDGPPVAPACAGSPGNTVGVYHSLCSASGTLYLCNNSSGCSVSADWATSAGSGTITGITTASGSGLQGGGSSGSLTMALASCSANQIQVYSGSTWGCLTVYNNSAYLFANSTSPGLTVTTSYAAVPGASVTFVQPGHYLVTGNAVFVASSNDFTYQFNTRIQCGSGPTNSINTAITLTALGVYTIPVQFVYDSTTGTDTCGLYVDKSGGTGSSTISYPATSISAVWVAP